MTWETFLSFGLTRSIVPKRAFAREARSDEVRTSERKVNEVKG